MKEILLIFIGGGAGSLIRFFLGKFIQSNFESNFPYSTLIINILASLILGFLVGKVFIQNQNLRLLLAIGFCGGFSTFSTFSYESIELLQNGRFIETLTYIFLSIILCLSATYAGIILGRI